MIFTDEIPTRDTPSKIRRPANTVITGDSTETFTETRRSRCKTANRVTLCRNVSWKQERSYQSCTSRRSVHSRSLEGELGLRRRSSSVIPVGREIPNSPLGLTQDAAGNEGPKDRVERITSSILPVMPDSRLIRETEEAVEGSRENAIPVVRAIPNSPLTQDPNEGQFEHGEGSSYGMPPSPFTREPGHLEHADGNSILPAVVHIPLIQDPGQEFEGNRQNVTPAISQNSGTQESVERNLGGVGGIRTRVMPVMLHSLLIQETDSEEEEDQLEHVEEGSGTFSITELAHSQLIQEYTFQHIEHVEAFEIEASRKTAIPKLAHSPLIQESRVEHLEQVEGVSCKSVTPEMPDNQLIQEPDEGHLDHVDNRRKTSGLRIDSNNCAEDIGRILTAQSPNTRTLYKFWRDKTLCDVIIHVGGTRFFAHSLVMAAVCEKFTRAKRSVKNDMMEIIIPKIRANVMKDVLKYVYTSCIGINEDNISEVLYVSKRLGINKLLESCIDFLTNITVDNAFSHLQVAQKYRLTDVLSVLTRYIQDNFAVVLTTEAFLESDYRSMYTILSSEDLRAAYDAMVIFRACKAWIDYDKNRRIHHAAALMKLVNFMDMNPRDIASQLEPLTYIFGEPACSCLLYDAYKIHALRQEDGGDSEESVSMVTKGGNRGPVRQTRLQGTQYTPSKRYQISVRPNHGATNITPSSSSDEQHGIKALFPNLPASVKSPSINKNTSSGAAGRKVKSASSKRRTSIDSKRSNNSSTIARQVEQFLPQNAEITLQNDTIKLDDASSDSDLEMEVKPNPLRRGTVFCAKSSTDVQQYVQSMIPHETDNSNTRQFLPENAEITLHNDTIEAEDASSDADLEMEVKPNPLRRGTVFCAKSSTDVQQYVQSMIPQDIDNSKTSQEQQFLAENAEITLHNDTIEVGDASSEADLEMEVKPNPLRRGTVFCAKSSTDVQSYVQSMIPHETDNSNTRQFLPENAEKTLHNDTIEAEDASSDADLEMEVKPNPLRRGTVFCAKSSTDVQQYVQSMIPHETDNSKTRQYLPENVEITLHNDTIEVEEGSDESDLDIEVKPNPLRRGTVFCAKSSTDVQQYVQSMIPHDTDKSKTNINSISSQGNTNPKSSGSRPSGSSTSRDRKRSQSAAKKNHSKSENINPTAANVTTSQEDVESTDSKASVAIRPNPLRRGTVFCTESAKDVLGYVQSLVPDDVVSDKAEVSVNLQDKKHDTQPDGSPSGKELDTKHGAQSATDARITTTAEPSTSTRTSPSSHAPQTSSDGPSQEQPEQASNKENYVSKFAAKLAQPQSEQDRERQCPVLKNDQQPSCSQQQQKITSPPVRPRKIGSNIRAKVCLFEALAEQEKGRVVDEKKRNASPPKKNIEIKIISPPRETNIERETKSQPCKTNIEMKTLALPREANIEVKTKSPPRETNVITKTSYPARETNIEMKTISPPRETNVITKTSYPARETNIEMKTISPPRETNVITKTSYPARETNIEMKTKSPPRETNVITKTSYPARETNIEMKTISPPRETNVITKTNYPERETNFQMKTISPPRETNIELKTKAPQIETNTIIYTNKTQALDLVCTATQTSDLDTRCVTFASSNEAAACSEPDRLSTREATWSDANTGYKVFVSTVQLDESLSSQLSVSSSPYILVFGGQGQQNVNPDTPGSIESGVQRFDPTLNCWDTGTGSSMPTVLQYIAVTVCRGGIYVTGGATCSNDGDLNPTDVCYRYDELTDTWHSKAHLRHARCKHASVALNDSIYVIGGMDKSGMSMKTVEMYYPRDDRWVFTRPLEDARVGAAAVTHRGCIFVAGGNLDTDQNFILDTIEVFDPRTGKWTFRYPLPTPVCDAALADVMGVLYMAGGYFMNGHTQQSIDSVFQYHDETDTWSEIYCLDMPRHGAILVGIDTCLYVIGGVSTDEMGYPVSDVECIQMQPGDEHVHDPAPLPIPGHGLAGCLFYTAEY